MTKKYTPKKFSPIIYPEWGELFKTLTDKQKGDILMGVAMFPSYEPSENPVWAFIKSQIQNQLDDFTEKCQKNGNIIRNYWRTRVNERLTNDNEGLTKGNEGEPKPELLPEPELLYKPEPKYSLDNVDNFGDIVKKVGSLNINKNKIVISSKFSASDYDELKVYVQEMPEDVIHSVESWLIKTKLGQTVDISFITKQFMNFAKRQGRPIFKEQDK